MKTLTRCLTLAALGTGAWFLVSTENLAAQDRPAQRNFDPQQMRQRMLDRMRDQFEVKDDAEWKLLSERIAKLMDARRAGGGFGGPGGFRGFGGPGGPPPASAEGQRRPGQPPPPNDDGPPEPPGPEGPGDALGGPDGPGAPGGPPAPGMMGPPGGPMGFGRDASPEFEALRQALENKASSAELKTKLGQLRDARKKREADLEKAQEDLRQILSVRQEAIAVTLGLLK